ncbi:zinc finger BED domain-containing protein RICESLEEPER 2-like [Rhizophagus irregularis DAOM 181602=DAOM 197198]|nr:zinc finger BED domain-containing protein RICESLEEPER 2-like [Rhizophagus irregularis DAOM 181602=DAOM 197198]
MSEAEKTSLRKRNYLRSELFTRELFKENDFSSQHKNRHLERNHPDKNPKKAKNLIIESQNTLDEFVGHTTFPSKFTQKDFHWFVFKWVIDNDQLFTILENKYFCQMIKILNSDALVLSANTIKNDILESFNVEQKKIKELFQGIPERISFALNSWTSMNGYAFLAITTHWITKDWRLQDKLLDFIDLSGLHSGENLCNAFVKSCHEFRILAKVFAVISDNASNNITFMKHLEDVCHKENIFFNAINSHCRCLAHIINLVVQEILKQLKAGEAQTEDDIMNNMDATINAGEIIPKLRRLVVKIRLSPQCQERFARHSEAVNLKDLKLILDTIDAMVNSDRDLRSFEITDDEWNKIKEIISVLKIFVQTTKILSSAKYPITYCENFDSSSDIVIAVKAGLEKLKIYYEKTDDTTMYTIATVFDPRFKLNYYENNKWKQSFIHYAKETVLNAYNNNYAPVINVEVNDNNDKDNEFLDHIFGKK